MISLLNSLQIENKFSSIWNSTISKQLWFNLKKKIKFSVVLLIVVSVLLMILTGLSAKPQYGFSDPGINPDENQVYIQCHTLTGGTCVGSNCSSC